MNAEIQKLCDVSGEITVRSDCIFSFGLHTHAYYEMTLYEPFDGRILLNGHSVTVDSITAVLVCPCDFHEIIVSRPCTAKFIKIGFNADNLTDEIPTSPVVLSDIRPDAFLCTLFREILASTADSVGLKLLLNSALHILLRDGRRIHPAVSRSGEIAVAAARILNENYRGSVSLESVARRLSVSPQYLSESFSANLNVHFSGYLLRLRLGHAERLIARTAMDMTEICYESGFGNYSHFSRKFRSHYGCSPREYRNRMKLSGSAGFPSENAPEKQDGP